MARQRTDTWVLTPYLVSNAIVLPITWGAPVRRSAAGDSSDPPVHLHGELAVPRLAPTRTMIAFRCYRARAAAGCSRWRRPFWPIPSAAAAGSRSRSLITVVVALSWDRPWAAGSPTTNVALIFLINLPVGLLTSFLVFRLVGSTLAEPSGGRPSQDRLRRRGCRPRHGALQSCSASAGARLVRLTVHRNARGARRVGHRGAGDMGWFYDDPIVDIHLSVIPIPERQRDDVRRGHHALPSLVMMPQFLQLLLGYSSEAQAWCSGGGIPLLCSRPSSGPCYEGPAR